MGFTTQDDSGERRPWALPLAALYGIAVLLHRRLWLRPVHPVPALPLIVVGSLRAGGAGKTPVTAELARLFSARGLRVGILAYRIGGRSDSEVHPNSDWRESSDEAVLLARQLREQNGARVFSTRDRSRLWRELDAGNAFDVLLSDDGLMDMRLAGALRVVLARPGEHPSWRDLLPAGPFRLTARALRTATFVLRGPSKVSGSPMEHRFSREPVFPNGFDFSRSYWLPCGLGDPTAFRRSLESAGVRIAGITAGRDHSTPDLARARRDAAQAAANGFLVSAKDAVKLREPSGLVESEAWIEIGERVTFSPEFVDALVERTVGHRSSGRVSRPRIFVD